MKQLLLISILLGTLVFTSCKNDQSPTIEFHELGMNNTRTVNAGGDLHIDAEILAPLKIASIRLEIHSDEEHGNNASTLEGTHEDQFSEWEVDILYTGKYVGLKNTDFHEHIDVPATATPGHYHLLLIVTDMEGNQTKAEAEIEVLSAD